MLVPVVMLVFFFVFASRQENQGGRSGAECEKCFHSLYVLLSIVLAYRLAPVFLCCRSHSVPMKEFAKPAGGRGAICFLPGMFNAKSDYENTQLLLSGVSGYLVDGGRTGILNTCSICSCEIHHSGGPAVFAAVGKYRQTGTGSDPKSGRSSRIRSRSATTCHDG
jgi:hypothetical protein